MPAPLSLDLRKRVVEGVKNGEKHESLALRFGVGTASIGRWWRRWTTTGELAATPTGGRKSSLDEAARAHLRGFVEVEPDATLARLIDLLAAEIGFRSNDSTMSRVLAEMGLTRKKSRSSTTGAWKRTSSKNERRSKRLSRA